MGSFLVSNKYICDRDLKKLKLLSCKNNLRYFE